MFWNLVALIVAGVGAAGIGLILRSLSRNKLPKWIVPVFAGIGMLAYQINSEYSWFDHKTAQLPKDSVVIETRQDTMLWRPWSFIKPMTTAFTVLDTSNVTLSQVENDIIAEFQLYQFEQQHTDRVIARPYLLNCQNGQMLLLNDQRKPDLDTLKELGPENALRTRLCGS